MRRIILCLGLIMLAAAIRLIVMVGFSNNTLFVSGISAALLGYGYFYRRLIQLKWLNIALCTAALSFIGLLIFIAVYGRIDTVTYKEDAALVLGCGIRGETVSLSLKMRLDKAVAYHQKNPDALIVVTGGQGPLEDITEALAMERYLISRGVSDDRIIREEKSLSTYENMQFSKRILDQIFNGNYSVAIITSEFHLYRSMRFASMAGINGTKIHSGTPWYTQPMDYVRECAAVIKLWVFKR